MIELEQAKLHLRVDHDEEDELIQGMIDASICAAADYLGAPIVEILGDDTNPAIDAAILLQVADLYENRERQTTDASYNQNPTYERLLNPYRVMVM